MLKDKKVEITKKDYLTFRYLGFIYDYSSIITVLWVSVLSIFVLADYALNKRSLIIAIIALFMLISYINSIFFKMPKTAKQEFENKTFPNPEYTISIDENKLTVLRATSTPSEIEFSSLYSTFETVKQFCFFVSENNYLILPKTLLTKEEIVALKKIIKSLPTENKRNPFSVGMKALLKTFFMLLFITICAVLIVLAYKIS